MGITLEHIQGASASLYAAGTETVRQASFTYIYKF